MGASPCCCTDKSPVPKLEYVGAINAVEVPKGSPKDSPRNGGRKDAAGNSARINSARLARKKAKAKTGDFSSGAALASPFAINDFKDGKSPEEFYLPPANIAGSPKLSARSDADGNSARPRKKVEHVHRQKMMLGMMKPKQLDSDSSDSSDSDNSNPRAGPSLQEVTDQELSKVAEELKAGHFDNALLVACHGGLPKAFEQCVYEGAHVNCEDANGIQAAYFATLSGSFETFKLILKYDVHHLHTASWFDAKLMTDDMTLLMMALRHGLTEIYEYLVIDLGCQLRLIGCRFGVDQVQYRGGLAPVRRWLSFLPEVTCRRDLPKKRHVKFLDEAQSALTGIVIMKTVHLGRHPSSYSDKEFEEHRQRRLHARNFVQSVIKKLQELEEERVRAEAEEIVQDALNREKKRSEAAEAALQARERMMHLME